MVIRTASVFVRKGKAYIPVMARTEMGVYVATEPVQTSDLTPEALVAALEKVLAAGHPSIPHPAQQEWRRLARKAPILRAAQVRSWKEFSLHNAVYDIDYTEDAVTLFIVQLDHLGRAEYASAKRLSFVKDAPLLAIVEAILEDIRLRPELLSG